MNPQIVFLLNQSLESLRNSNLESAELYLKQALRLQSSNPHVLRLLGVIAAQRRQYSDALKYLNDSLKALPKNSLALSNLGNVFFELKEYSNALDACDKSIKIDPKYEEAWSNKANILYELKRYDEALEHYDKALSLKPDQAEVWSNKGNTLHDLRRYDEALAHHDKALSLKPGYSEAWSNKANVLHDLRRYDEALAHHDKALSIKPDYAEAWSNKGVTLHELKYYDEASAHYDKALSLKPDIDWVYGELLHTKMKICSWSSLDECLENIENKILKNEKVIRPFQLLNLCDDSFLQKKCSETYAKDGYPTNLTLGLINKYPKKDKIRVAYFSPDFRNHPVSYLISELFEIHDRNRFEILAFSLQKAPDGDEVNIRLRKGFDVFMDVENMSDLQIAQLARQLEVDIAIDLSGPTLYARPGIFSYRAAPIQVNYLGYPGTTGADCIDYIIADKTIIPIESQSHYSEAIVYLPNSYQANDRNRLISDMNFTRLDLGLPANGFVFCCFNNNFKILPETFDGWMRILKAVDGSVLWLFQDNPLAVQNLKKEATKRGIDSKRLVFAERMVLPEHLARHRQADLFLDTVPYNAHTTTSDALWAGLPVLTLVGRSFAGRVAASLLNAIRLPELIARTQGEYEALAIELATNPKKLTEIKLKLANNRLTSPLFDTPLFAKNIEAAYIRMYEQYQADLEPEHISIS